MHFAPITYLWGTEEYLLDRWMEGLLADCAAEDGEPPEVIRADAEETSPAELRDILGESSLFSLRRMIVIKEPRWLKGSGGKRSKTPGEYETVIGQYLESNPDLTHLIIRSAAAPPAGPLQELVKKYGSVTEIPAYDGKKLSDWLKRCFADRGLEAGSAVIDAMAGSGRDMYYLMSEMDRLTLCLPGAVIRREDLSGLDPELPETNVFKLTDALLRKNTAEAMNGLNLLIIKGQPAVLIVHMIAREFATMGKIRTLYIQGMTRQEIADHLKQKPFRVDKMLSARFTTLEDITRVFGLLAETDRGLKSTSSDDRLLLENLIVNITA